MSGRDLKNLIKKHRINSTNSSLMESPPPSELSSVIDHKNLSKLLDKKPLVKYKTIDYEEQRDLINEKREAVDNSLARVKKIEDKSKQKRENFFMKCHNNVWIREWNRLIAQYRSCEQDLTNYSKLFESNSVDYIDLDQMDDDEVEETLDNKNQIDDLEHFAQLLDDDRLKFKVKTVCPIDDLVEDVKFYLKKRRPTSLGGVDLRASVIASNNEQDQRVAETVESVKEQQKRLLEQLESECFRLNNEVNEFAEQLDQEEVTRGIPIDAFQLDCPNEELKISVLQEFIIIDFKYEEKLSQLNDSYKSQAENGAHNTMGWTQSDHDMFQHIQDQYQTHTMPHLPANVTARELMLDRLKRTFKSSHRSDLLKQEEWSDASRYFQQQRRLVMTEWASAKRALLLKAEAVFAEAYEALEREKEVREERERQRRVCERLYEKVSWWRERKLEALEMEQRLARADKRRKAERARLERDKLNEKRNKDKQAIAEYNGKLEAEKHRAEAEEREKLDKLKQMLNEQSVKDRERIEYRNRLLAKRREEVNSKKQVKQLENEDKEKKLEKFFDSVKPNVESDPIRAISYTESTLMRRGVKKHNHNHQKEEANEFNDQKPIYGIHTFNEKQISSDARVRIEERLRQAGLINSEYARAVVNDFGIAKHQQMRRDLNANAGWDGFSMK